MKSSETSADESPDSPPSGPTRRTVLGAIGLTATAALAGCTVAGDVGRETTTEQYSVAGDDVDRIGVSGGDGETVVRGWDGTDVRIEATKYARGKTDLSDVRVTRDVVDGRLAIGAETTDGLSVGASGGGLEAVAVEVPRDISVDRVGIDDGNGDVTDVAGDLELDVGDGSADVGPVDGSLRVDADDGDITVGNVDSVTGKLADGTLRMTEPARLGDLRVDDGTLELAVGTIESQPTVTADDGDVTARIGPELDATVLVKADDAPVRTDSDLFDSLETTDGTVRGQVGDGSGRLIIEINDGSVQLRPL
jgi:hypothetical protein